MKAEAFSKLSRREREMMDIIFAKQRATAQEVRDALSSPPSYSAVRATLRILEDKGHLVHEQEGAAYVYRPTIAKDVASRSALKRIVDTFFGGSAKKAVAALLEESDGDLSAADRKKILAMIARAEREGR
jgi:BlaI family transcriptional regulator, penicillinase repressor